MRPKTAKLKEAPDISFPVDVHVHEGGAGGEARHGADVSAEGVHKARPGGEPYFPDGEPPALETSPLYFQHCGLGGRIGSCLIN
jgi:hypothetical protein